MRPASRTPRSRVVDPEAPSRVERRGDSETGLSVARPRAPSRPARERGLVPHGGEHAFRWSVDPWPGATPGFPLFEKVTEPGGVSATRTRIPSAAALARWVRRDLERVGPAERIAIGALGDPWPADEKTAPRTRILLGAFLDCGGHRLRIVTRSDLVSRDIDLLESLSERHEIEVALSIPSLDRRLTAALEPGMPRPDLRLRTISLLAAASIPVGLRIAPVLPDVNDDPGGLGGLASAAASAGATTLTAHGLPLAPSDLRAHFPGLEREMPDRFDRARARYEATATLPDEYRRGLADLVARLRRGHRLKGSPGTQPRVARPERVPQLDLF